jgi:uncharacterized protein (TIGR00255 family)
MTGFGLGEADIPGGRVRVEVRTVNHRFFSANLRLGRGLEEHETLVRDALRDALRRGHANVSVRLETDADEAPPLHVDMARARSLARALETLRDELGLQGGVDLGLVARFGDVITAARDEGPAVPAQALRTAVEAAAAAVIAMREQEGEALAADLLGRADAIAEALAHVEARAPRRLEEESERLRARVAELVEGVDVDPDRLAQEVAYLAERWDIGEEAVRLRAHLDHLRATLAHGADEPIGKRLGFLVQEMHREVNTIGSKANDTEIAHRVIGMKNDVERLREQVENVD